MEDTHGGVSRGSSMFQSTLSSKVYDLIDVPLNQKIRENVSALFNYLDMYGPKIPFLHVIVTYIRLFQYIGGSFMATNQAVFDRGTLSFKVIDIVSVLFHIIPVSYREGIEWIVLYVSNGILTIFLFYLIITSFRYRATSVVSKRTTFLLTIFMSFVPFILIPISIQYAGQIISLAFVSVKAIPLVSLIAIGFTIFNFVMYSWIIVACYTKTLTFRNYSFQSIEGGPQCKLFFMTNLITFVSSITSYLKPWYSFGLVIFSALCYLYNLTTVFNCGTFVFTRDQTMVLGGSILGFLLCCASVYPILDDDEWPDYFPACLAGVAVIVFALSNYFIQRRVRKDLLLLDEFESTLNFDIIGSKNKFKQIVGSGFANNHQMCADFIVFKAAVEKWPNDIDVWFIYAKFVSIYPELSSVLIFISTSMQHLVKKNPETKHIINNIGQIIKSRESKFSQDVKSRIAKLTKQFNKTKAKLRNIWDLILQGNTNELDYAIKNAFENTHISEVEVNQLMMLYPNNRYVMRQYYKFLNEIKSDLLGARKCQDNIVLLQKGISINQDTLYELGYIAFPYMSEFTDMLANKSERITTDNEVSGLDEVIGEDFDSQKIESLKKLIDNAKIPAIKFMLLATIIPYIFFVLIPVLVMGVSFTYYANKLEEPLNYLYGIAYIRNLINMLPTFIGKYVLEEMDDPKNTSQKLMGHTQLDPRLELKSYGRYRTMKEITQYLCSIVPDTTKLLTGLRTFKEGNAIIEEVRTKVFSNVLPFNFYLNSKDVRKTQTSLVQLIYMIATHCTKVLEFTVVDVSVGAGLDAVTSRSNDVTTTRVSSEALMRTVDYIREQDSFYQKLFQGMMFAGIGLAIIVFSVLTSVELKKLKKCKEVLYGIFATLPKVVLSNISMSFNKTEANMSSTMKASANSDVNKQEEGIIKIFSSVNDGSDSGSFHTFIIFDMIVICACSCLAFLVLMESYSKASNTLVSSCHHINYLYGSICYMFSIVSSIFTILPSFHDPSLKEMCPVPSAELYVFENNIPIVAKYLNLLQLGGGSKEDPPFSGMKQAILDSDVILDVMIPEGLPTTIIESAHSFKTLGQLYLSTALMIRFYSQMKQDHWPRLRGDGVEQLWKLGPLELYDSFYYEAGQKIIPTIDRDIVSNGSNINTYGTILCIAAFVFVLISVNFILHEEKLLRFMISNLMRVDPLIVFANQMIVDILTGTYKARNDNSGDKSAQFHADVMNKLNDIIIVCADETQKVISVNAAFEEMFGIKQDEIAETKINDFFFDGKFNCDTQIDKVLNHQTTLIYENQHHDKVYLEFTSQLVSGRKIYSGRNITQTLMHDKLIAEEKMKSDKMLASILPQCLVARVQHGEKNISFAVQSVSVLFLDIVEFTPWCGSHDAQYIMGMLNIIFKEFDQITNQHATMTKIKCIGDCYMAAGGIFDEVNQPAVHSKEVVNFGTLVIKKLLQINETHNEKLRIRVGVNTGGPIVAGVIGTEKPTFEILGPAINIAHEMEHHGVPMKVHISRPVYELIYGQHFEIKERGEIDVKGGKMFTYLVDP